MSPTDRAVGFKISAFFPLLMWFAVIGIALAILFHTSQAKKSHITFAIRVEGIPSFEYSATVNGNPYRSGDPCGVGSKSVVIKVKNAEPFQTKVFTWYSGVNLGAINLAWSKGTLNVEVAPGENKVLVRGEHFQKELLNCSTESVSVPAGNYEIVSRFERFTVAKLGIVERNGRTKV